VTASQPDSSGHESAPAAVLDRALALVRFLRDHCPWDAAQTPRSLTRYLLEEAHETAEAAAAEDPAALRDELGDLLLNVAFQVVIAEERGWFTRTDVVERLEQKMRRRHPHLYGLGEREEWEVIKRRERGDSGGILGGVPASGDPLTRAYQIQDAVARVGFDWNDWRGAWEKVREETEEVREALEGSGPDHQEEELGDLLFAMVNLVRLSSAHPVPALARANAKFAGRFASLEALATERSVPLGEATLEELDLLWDEVKRRERSAAG
jgi:MazG family protein